MDWSELQERSGKDWSKPFNAAYSGECAGCGGEIETDDEVRYCDGELVHVGCED